MSGERANGSCTNCGSSDVFQLSETGQYECQQCGKRRKETNDRIATINRDTSGNSLGATIYLSTEQLQELGIDPDAGQVRYYVKDGQLHVEEARYNG